MVDFLKYIKWKVRNKNKNRVHYKARVNDNTILADYVTIHKNTNVINTEIGFASYIGWNCNFSNCKIGKFTSIAPYSEVIYGKHPVSKFVSTHPCFYSVEKQSGFTFVNRNTFDEYTYADSDLKKSVVIGNDVWIGYGVKILEGVIIGDGAIIGAGSIVTKNIEPYSICVGSPAKVIRFRFEKEKIDKLLKYKWWNKDFQWISENCKFFNDVDMLIREINDKNNRNV